MIDWTRCSLVAVLSALSVAIGEGSASAQPANGAVPTVNAAQGTVVRWEVPGAKRCGMGGRSWAALQETCYYPIDVSHVPGIIRVNSQGVGPVRFAHISVGASSRGSEDVDLGDIPQAKPSPADIRRNVRDQALVAKVWTIHEGPARFSLPLGAPLEPLPEGKGFGTKWIFNGKPGSSEIHSGADYAVRPGRLAVAIADGTVVIADDLFFTGKAVFIDHGNGLVSMYFHFSEIKVQAGQEVRKGDPIGLVGSTGRVSGPHLHLGVRWHGARIDPQPLLEDPAKLLILGK